jgi:uncharacterized membrane protein
MRDHTLLVRALLEWIGSVGFALFAGGLFGRGFCLRRLLTVREARMVRLSDAILWASAGILVAQRILLAVSQAGSGLWFRFVGGAEIAQAAIVLVVLALDIWPMRRFRSWARFLDLDQVPYHTDADQDRMNLLWRIQIASLLVLPLLDPLARLIAASR